MTNKVDGDGPHWWKLLLALAVWIVCLHIVTQSYLSGG
jgi:hypothetical protein